MAKIKKSKNATKKVASKKKVPNFVKLAEELLRALVETSPPSATAHPDYILEKHSATDQNNIRNWRLYRGIQMQKELAELTKKIDPDGVGLNRVTICKLESGQTPYNQEHLRILSHALKVAPRDLIGTDPFNAGDIFKQYADIPVQDRPKAIIILKR